MSLKGPIQIKGDLLANRPTVGYDRQLFFARDVKQFFVYDQSLPGWVQVNGSGGGSGFSGAKEITANYTVDLATDNGKILMVDANDVVITFPIASQDDFSCWVFSAVNTDLDTLDSGGFNSPAPITLTDFTVVQVVSIHGDPAFGPGWVVFPLPIAPPAEFNQFIQTQADVTIDASCNKNVYGLAGARTFHLPTTASVLVNGLTEFRFWVMNSNAIGTSPTVLLLDHPELGQIFGEAGIFTECDIPAGCGAMVACSSQSNSDWFVVGTTFDFRPYVISAVAAEASARASADTTLQTNINAKQDALGFTPENVANKDTTVTLGASDTKYPSQNAVKSYVDTGLATKAAASHTHPESDITSLTTDLAAKTPTSRSISTTAPLTGGGDLTADRTLAISNFTGDAGSGGAKGAVPAPAAGDAAANKFLKADGTWASTPAAPVTSVAGRTGAVTLTESDVSNLTTDLAAKAPLASPALTGTPTAPTQSVDDNSTKLATTAYVTNQLSAVADGTPAVDGTAARGTSTHAARADHVHPTDTGRAAASHTHPESDITSLTTDLANKINTSARGAASGVASLDAGTRIPVAQMPLCDVVNGTGITFKRAATAQNTGNNPRTDVTIAINPGETVVVVMNCGGASLTTVDPRVSDDGGNPYTMSLAVNNNAGTTHVFVCLNASTVATKLRVSNGSSAGVTTVAASAYGGVKSIGAAGTGNTVETITLATTVANSYMVAGLVYFKSGATISYSSDLTGTTRANQNSSSTTTTVGIAITDNTQAGTGNLVCAVNLNTTVGVSAASVAVELIPA